MPADLAALLAGFEARRSRSSSSSGSSGSHSVQEVVVQQVVQSHRVDQSTPPQYHTKRKKVIRARAKYTNAKIIIL